MASLVSNDDIFEEEFDSLFLVRTELPGKKNLETTLATCRTKGPLPRRTQTRWSLGAE